jgi:hypothetical protein
MAERLILMLTSQRMIICAIACVLALSQPVIVNGGGSIDSARCVGLSFSLLRVATETWARLESVLEPNPLRPLNDSCSPIEWRGDLPTAQKARFVPAYLLHMAARPALEFTALLATASVPSGIEVKEADDRFAEVPSNDVSSTQSVTEESVVTAFNQAHEDYVATLIDDVFVIRPVGASVEFLDRPSTLSGHVIVVGILQAERTIFSPLDITLLQPAVGSGLGREAAKGLVARLLLDGTGGRRVIDTLNQIVLQMPGAWQVTICEREHTWRIARFGFIFADRSRSMYPMSKQ